jgi:fido (protein-threonine AMPylation protein)
MSDFEVYIRESEPHKGEKGYAWRTAIGLQAVDGLKPSEYLIETARQHIEGDISIDEARQLIMSYYQSKDVRTKDTDETEEADKASVNIAKLLNEKSFAFSVVGLTSIHKHIFQDVFKFAGKIRDYNITKKEWVLRDDTVLYVSAPDIRPAIEHDLEREKEFDYTNLSMPEVISHLTKFVSSLWQIHPFGEGNTRAIAVFTIQYLRSMGFNVKNDLFSKHSWYFRNALVRANYQNIQLGVKRNPEYLELFFHNLLMGEKNELKNRYLIIQEQGDPQSITSDSPKAQIDTLNCTLEERALLDCLTKNPHIKQQEVVLQLGKSIATVKRLTASLVIKGLLERRNGKRNGFWEVKDCNKQN